MKKCFFVFCLLASAASSVDGQSQAMHLANCSYITLRNLKVRGFAANGINIDDGGSYGTPAHNIVLENIIILETGPKGNHDALKMSGVDHFTVRKCRFEGWGGSGIDMVGCHHGIVEDCTFTGKEGFSQSNGVQLKGGTEDVLVQCCFFKNAGQRSVNLGGSTGLQFFRPKVQDYEARNITVAGNRFVGGMAPIIHFAPIMDYIRKDAARRYGRQVGSPRGEPE